MNILLLEDDLTTAEQTQKLLEKFNHNVKIINNGLDFLEYIRHNHENHDAILIDLGLPGINGLSVANLLKHYLKINIPIICITGQTLIDLKDSPFKIVLYKPVHVVELQSAILKIKGD